VNVTEEMLDAAIRKAVEAGLLPRHARHEDLSGNQELIRYILQAALDTLASVDPERRPGGQLHCHSVLHRFTDGREKYWNPGYAQQ
jgi:hypothetical protein